MSAGASQFLKLTLARPAWRLLAAIGFGLTSFTIFDVLRAAGAGP